MNVGQIMVKAVPCSPETNLAAATEILLDEDCGVLPVVDHAGKLLGMVTDRDICIALGTRNRAASDLTVGDVASPHVHTCRSEDSLSETLTTMASAQVRRLPVVDSEHRLQGVLSISDIIRHTHAGKQRRDGNPTADEVIAALRGICAQREGKRTQRAA